MAVDAKHETSDGTADEKKLRRRRRRASARNTRTMHTEDRDGDEEAARDEAQWRPFVSVSAGEEEEEEGEEEGEEEEEEMEAEEVEAEAEDEAEGQGEEQDMRKMLQGEEEQQQQQQQSVAQDTLLRRTYLQRMCVGRCCIARVLDESVSCWWLICCAFGVLLVTDSCRVRIQSRMTRGFGSLRQILRCRCAKRRSCGYVLFCVDDIWGREMNCRLFSPTFRFLTGSCAVH